MILFGPILTISILSKYYSPTLIFFRVIFESYKLFSLKQKAYPKKPKLEHYIMKTILSFINSWGHMATKTTTDHNSYFLEKDRISR